MEQKLTPYLPPQAGSFFWSHRGSARLPRKADGSLLLPDVCVDLREGRGDQYLYLIEGRGSTIKGQAEPLPCTDADSKRKDRRARMKGAAEKKKRAKRRLDHVEWRYDPEAKIPIDEEDVEGGVQRRSYQIRFKHHGTFHWMPDSDSLNQAHTGNSEDIMLTIKVEENLEKKIEGSEFSVSRGELEWVLKNYGPVNLRNELEMARITANSRKLELIIEKFLLRHDRLIRDHATGWRYTPIELWEDYDPLGQGRTNRRIKGRTAKVTNSLREALSALSLDHWHRCLLVTVSPPPDVDDVQFLREAEACIRAMQLGPEPFYWLRSTETRAWRPRGAFDHPAPPGLHDHTLMCAWGDLLPQQRRDWADYVEGRLLEHMIKQYPNMCRQAIHVQLVNDRQHMTRLVRGERGRAPYMCKDVEDPGRIIGRRWWNDGNPDPDLGGVFENGGILNQVQVSGDRWQVHVDEATFKDIKQRLHDFLDRPLPAYAVQFAFYALEPPTIFRILVEAGVNVSAVPWSWRVRRPTILDDIPASLGIWRRARAPD